MNDPLLFQKLRKKTPLKQTYLAKLLGETRSNYSKKERSLVPFRYEEAVIVLKALKRYLSDDDLKSLPKEMIDMLSVDDENINVDSGEIERLKARIKELEASNARLREDEERARFYMEKAESKGKKLSVEYKELINTFWGRERKDDTNGGGKDNRTLPPNFTP